MRLAIGNWHLKALNCRNGIRSLKLDTLRLFQRLLMQPRRSSFTAVRVGTNQMIRQ